MALKVCTRLRSGQRETGRAVNGVVVLKLRWNSIVKMKYGSKNIKGLFNLPNQKHGNLVADPQKLYEYVRAQLKRCGRNPFVRGAPGIMAHSFHSFHSFQTVFGPTWTSHCKYSITPVLLSASYFAQLWATYQVQNEPRSAIVSQSKSNKGTSQGPRAGIAQILAEYKAKSSLPSFWLV